MGTHVAYTAGRTEAVSLNCACTGNSLYSLRFCRVYMLCFQVKGYYFQVGMYWLPVQMCHFYVEIYFLGKLMKFIFTGWRGLVFISVPMIQEIFYPIFHSVFNANVLLIFISGYGCFTVSPDAKNLWGSCFSEQQSLLCSYGVCMGFVPVILIHFLLSSTG